MTGSLSTRVGMVPGSADVLHGLDDQVVDEDLLGMSDVQHRGFIDHRTGFSRSVLGCGLVTKKTHGIGPGSSKIHPLPVFPETEF